MPVLHFGYIGQALLLVTLAACDAAGTAREPSAGALSARTGDASSASEGRLRHVGAPVRDDYGHVVAIRSAPRRIVSLNPATTELLFAIGAGNRVVGRTHYDLWPDSARLVSDLGAGIRPNIEAVLATRPDLVILYASSDDRSAADQLIAAGIPTAAFRIDRIADFRRVTLDLGQLVADTLRARTVVDSVAATLDRVRRATAALPRPRVFFHAWEKPLITIGGGSFLSELVSIAGGENVYGSLTEPSAAVTFEDVVRRDPDIVLVSPIERARMLASDRWRSLRAVRAGRVLAYDTNLVGRPSVKLGQAAVSLASLLHPRALR
jgi:ABC-type Fe3+-hydroxamate transport system substrate-binding protein